MKTFIKILIILGFSHCCHATVFSGTGQVQQVQSVDRTTYGANDSFAVSGFSSAGLCATSDGLIGINLADDEGGRRQLSIILSARAMAHTVTVRVDDTKKNSAGFCYLQMISM